MYVEARYLEFQSSGRGLACSVLFYPKIRQSCFTITCCAALTGGGVCGGGGLGAHGQAGKAFGILWGAWREGFTGCALRVGGLMEFD